MPAPLLILALAAAQPAAPSAAVGHGRAFISPMGEPFHGAGDGLTIWFQQADRNRDGSLTMDEVRQDAQRFFLTLDANQDGEIDPDEVTRYETVIAPEIRTGVNFETSESVNDEATGGGRIGLLTIPEPVTAADSNLDRGVSAQEFATAAEKRFRLLDHDGDGRLTLPELEGARSAVRSNARRPRTQPDAPAPTPQIPTSDVPTMGSQGY